MTREQIEEMVVWPLTIVDGVITHVYNGIDGKQRTASIPIDTLLELANVHATSEEDAKELISFTLEGLRDQPELERKVQEVDDMQKILKLASRYVYLRDVILKDHKRGDLPDMLREYFYEVEDVKYPKPDDYDRAIDELMINEDKLNG